MIINKQLSDFAWCCYFYKLFSYYCYTVTFKLVSKKLKIKS